MHKVTKQQIQRRKKFGWIMSNKEELRKVFGNVSTNERLAIMRVYVECEAARKKFGVFNSEYEAYGVICEELNEFWHLVQHHDKKWAGIDHMKAEVQSVAAMAVCYLIEIDTEFNDVEYAFIYAMNKIYKRYKFPVIEYSEVKSAHEAYAIMLLELDGFWDLVRNAKTRYGVSYAKRERMTNLGARALRFLIEM